MAALTSTAQPLWSVTFAGPRSGPLAYEVQLCM